MTYESELIKRFWEYQGRVFPHWKGILERPQADDNRPPVFLQDEAWRNLLVDPDLPANRKELLLSMISPSDRHRHFGSMKSSQAIAQSVWGNLAQSGVLSLLSDLTDDEGNLAFERARLSMSSLHLEFKLQHLGEPVPTSVDAFISGDYQVAIECKLCEEGIGTCSRPKESDYAKHCSGSYSFQNHRATRCSLTEIGVLYWKYVPTFFQWRADSDISPCPLNANYQLVRTILAATTGNGERQPLHRGHAVLVYDERNPAFKEGGNGFISFMETRNALRQPNLLRKCSWQRIVTHLREKKLLPWLTDQLMLKYGL